jgi:hypothetical protein
LITFALLVRGGDPIIRDFGSAAKHHRLHCPWLDPADSRAGLNGLRRRGRARRRAVPADGPGGQGGDA